MSLVIRASPALERFPSERDEMPGEPLPLDIPLIKDLQDIVLSFLPFKYERNGFLEHTADFFDIEMLCLKTGKACSEHLRNIAWVRQAEYPRLKIYGQPASYQLNGADDERAVSPYEKASTHWKNQKYLEITDSDINDDNLERTTAKVHRGFILQNCRLQANICCAINQSLS